MILLPSLFLLDAQLTIFKLRALTVSETFSQMVSLAIFIGLSWL